MLKKILIIAVITLLLILLAGWGYLLIKGKPGALQDIVSFPSSQSTDTQTYTTPQTSRAEDDTLTSGRTINMGALLTEVSPRPVAGAVLFERDGVPILRYMEKGTGHVYEASLETGELSRIIGTTIPRVVGAIWSPLGNRVVITTELEGTKESVMLTAIEKDDAGSYTLVETDFDLQSADNIAFGESGDVLYFTEENEGGMGYAYDLKTNTATEVFRTPFANVTADWNAGAPIVFPKPSAQARGYVYDASGASLNKLAEGWGMVAKALGSGVFFTNEMFDEGLASKITHSKQKMSLILETPVLADKCAYEGTYGLLCGVSNSLPQGGYPDLWYQGVVSLSDRIEHIDVETGVMTTIVDPQAFSGKQIDVVSVALSPGGSFATIINKRDGSLWLLNTTKAP